jgi:hypothetical protein
METGRIFLAVAVLATNALPAYAGALPNALGDPIERPVLISGGVGGGGDVRFSRVGLVGNTMYLADGALAIYDITDPAKPRQMGAYATDAEAFAVRVQGKIAFLQTTAGVVSLDISDATNPKQVKVPSTVGIEPEPETSDWTDIVAVVGNRGYISRGNGVVELEFHGMQLPGPVISSDAQPCRA